MIRPATPSDRDALTDLAIATGLFEPQELGELDGMLSEYFSGNLGSDHCWIVDEEDGLHSAAYYAPEMMADRTWNLYFIGVQPSYQGKGLGATLLRYVEQDLSSRNQRMLLVETSGLGTFEQTRAFYRKNQYEEEARIRDFYTSGDDKIVFRKVLGESAKD